MNLVSIALRKLAMVKKKLHSITFHSLFTACRKIGGEQSSRKSVQ
jgi:hypothetical protein